MQYSCLLLAIAAAVHANPFAMPQAVTEAISPSASPPPGCTPSAAGTYGIAVQNVSTLAPPAKRQVAELSDGQPEVKTMASITMSDGQPQAGIHTMIFMAAQIGDGQVQAQTTTYAPVTVISDGQPQAPTLPTPTITAVPVSQIGDGQPQAPTSTVVPVSQIGDAQPQAPSAAPPSPQRPASSDPGQSSADSGITMVACESEGTLAVTLADGVLKDGQGRTGYIASNFQFQFDAPPQAGAIYTTGFSACGNGTLALGGSNVFYQCLSGDFYNLYDRFWAPQCSPITINLLQLQTCS
ncbi:MAG: hypothetical protein LQ339_008199 [Xanthoria mediterranea]|nr:MAG: hypothetical protein LQ339_008199 [Xanthoria mediterranea]